MVPLGEPSKLALAKVSSYGAVEPLCHKETTVPQRLVQSASELCQLLRIKNITEPVSNVVQPGTIGCWGENRQLGKPLYLGQPGLMESPVQAGVVAAQFVVSLITHTLDFGLQLGSKGQVYQVGPVIAPALGLPLCLQVRSLASFLPASGRHQRIASR